MPVEPIYDGPDRRAQAHLSDDQIEEIAERAAIKAVEKMTVATYAAIGKGVVNKALTIIGIATVMLGVIGVKQGWIKL